MEKGLSDGYRERLFEGRYPVAFIFINVDPGTIDVNIHPNKKEVRFHDEKFISSIIEKAVKASLSEDGAVIEMGDYFPANDTPNKIKEDSSEQVDIKQILKSKREESLLCDSGKYAPTARDS